MGEKTGEAQKQHAKVQNFVRLYFFKGEKGISVSCEFDLTDLSDVPIKSWEDAVGMLEVEADKEVEKCRDLWEKANRGKTVIATGGQTIDSIPSDCFVR